MKYYVYILTNFTNSVLYIGVTKNIFLRTLQHQNKVNIGFSKKYNLYKLVYVEKFNYVLDALNREKQLKKWNRQWKIDLIKSENPKFNDLSKTFAKDLVD